ncbi:HEAT repeat domain-containing protein [Streptomyces sp. NPDC088252]|uniref:HEAT repeat domain-containing protein n=1 Tax=Streptomyces sp. NPDC088252 TaxID=3365845 RepID=UPI003806BE7D
MITADDNLLTGLDEVDWANLNHAYGTAADVPGQLRALCGVDEQARQQAVSSLFNHLAHQGTRYQASPYAVPFLARIALAGRDPAREHALELLTGLAVNWDEEREIIDGADIAAWRAEAAENFSDKLLPLYEEALAAEQGEQDEQRRRNLQDSRDWVAAGNPVDARDSSMRSYNAVLAELPALYGLLEHENPRVRTRTVYLLTWFPELAGTSLPLPLGLAAHEDDAVVKATSLVAVGILGTTALPTLTASLDAEDGLIRWAAAIAIAQTARSAAAELDGPLLDRAVAELATAAAAPAPVPATDYSLGDFHGHTADVLLALPPSPTSRAAVAACLPSVSTSQRASKAKAVLPDLFPSPLPDPRPPYTHLPRSQQQLLYALADLFEGWWNTEGDLGESLATYGLPATHAGLRAYIGLPTVDHGCWPPRI